MKKNKLFTLIFLFISTLSFAQYTLQDADVVVTDGQITSCRITDFNTPTYSDGVIIIPQTLDGQTVTGIADASSWSSGVFRNRDIKSIALPSSLQSIGNYAFQSNSISSLDLSNCTNLQSIGKEAFKYNSISSLDLSSCTNLRSIEESAFANNTDITSFNLPTNTQYPAYNWEDNTGANFAGGDLVTDMESFYYIPVPYTLQDDDVVVENGIIISCSYNFEFTKITIPQTLDGQTVTGIADAAAWNSGVFYNKTIKSLTLPSSLLSIGYSAFCESSISNLDLSACTNLLSIGDHAFQQNFILSLDLSACTKLLSIGEQVFYDNSISSLDLSNCTNLQSIERYAFYNNDISSLDLSSCTNLQTIGERAFNKNSISSLDLSSCTALIKIDKFAFADNNITSFNLPINTQYSSLYNWEDNTGANFAGGAQVTDMESYYYIPVPYTLQDNDVVVENGVIISCSYNFEFKKIIIPQILDDQTVLGIADATSRSSGVFYNKIIKSITLPSSLQSIGDYAFNKNDISSLDLSLCTNLQNIGYAAFQFNSTSSLNLSNCTNLISIGEEAFSENSISSLDLSSCTNLQNIGDRAFRNNSISSLDLSSCTALKSIGKEAFKYNSISSLDLSACTNLRSIEESAFARNSITSFNLPINTQYSSSYNWEDNTGDTYVGGAQVTDMYSYYYIAVPYTLQDDDVVVENGVIISCSYNYEFKKIIIPQTLDGQTVVGIADGSWNSGVFYNKTIKSITLPSSLQIIGYYAFKDNSISSLDLSNCTALQIIGNYAFAFNSISSLDLSSCTNLLSIESHAFRKNSISSLDLSNCTNLQSIGYYAFHSNSISSLNLSNCANLQTIVAYAFRDNSIPSLDLSSCTALKSIGLEAFQYNPISEFNLPTPNIPAYIFNHWVDRNSTTFAGGATVTDLTTEYTANLTATGKRVSFTILDAITNAKITNAAISLGIYGIRTSDYRGVAIFESVNDAVNIPYTVSKSGKEESGIITIAGAAISEDVFLCESAYSSTDALAICANELPYDYKGETIPTGTISGNIDITFSSILTGCDSIATLNLTISTVDASVTVNESTITAVEAGLEYQWLNCNDNYSAINAETNQSFTATVSGDYALEITSNSCIDTSACSNIVIASVLENTFAESINLYPNPTSGKVSLEFANDYTDIQIMVRTVEGKLVETIDYSNGEVISFNIKGRNGIYYIEVLSNNEKAVFKVIKE